MESDDVFPTVLPDGFTPGDNPQSAVARVDSGFQIAVYETVDPAFADRPWIVDTTDGFYFFAHPGAALGVAAVLRTEHMDMTR